MNKELRKAITIRTRFFLINIGKILVPQISLSIKDKQTFALSLFENLKKISTAILI